MPSPSAAPPAARKADHLRIAAGDGVVHAGASGLDEVLANLGAGQLADPDAAPRLVELLGADGLSIHLNPIQEAIQPEGEPRFAAALERIAAAVERIAPLPVVVKEVGFGMDAEDVRALRGVAVAAVDVAGAGGTNWALVEGRRAPAAGAVAAARAAAPDLPAIASGGVRDGVDVARCLALGPEHLR